MKATVSKPRNNESADSWRLFIQNEGERLPHLKLMGYEGFVVDLARRNGWDGIHIEVPSRFTIGTYHSEAGR